MSPLRRGGNFWQSDAGRAAILTMLGFTVLLLLGYLLADAVAYAEWTR